MSTFSADSGEDGIGGLAVARERPATTFFGLAFALSWGLWIPAWLGLLPTAGTITLGIFGPPVAAVLATLATGGSVRELLAGLVRWRVPLRWYGLVLAVPVAVVAASLPGGLALGYDLELGSLPVRAAVFPVSLTAMGLLGGGQEELGWRGFALPALQERLAPLPANLLLGVVWAVWHWPLFAIPAPGYGNLTLPIHGLGVVAMALVLGWLYNRTGSVLLAMLLHGSFNSAGLFVPLSRETLLRSPLGLELVQFAGFALVAAGVLWLGGPSLGADGGTRPEE